MFSFFSFFFSVVGSWALVGGNHLIYSTHQQHQKNEMIIKLYRFLPLSIKVCSQYTFALAYSVSVEKISNKG